MLGRTTAAVLLALAPGGGAAGDDALVGADLLASAPARDRDGSGSRRDVTRLDPPFSPSRPRCPR